MTNKELTSVAVKVFSIYVLVHAVLSVPYLVNTLITHGGFFENQGDNKFLLGLLGSAAFILLVFLAGILWKLANKVVEKSSDQVDVEESSKIDSSFLVSLLGFYLTFDGLLRFGYACASAFAQAQDGGDLSVQTKAYVAGFLIQIIIGITLVLKAEGWVRVLRWLQRAGLKGKT
jgi:hypothetical protein